MIDAIVRCHLIRLYFRPYAHRPPAVGESDSGAEATEEFCPSAEGRKHNARRWMRTTSCPSGRPLRSSSTAPARSARRCFRRSHLPSSERSTLHPFSDDDLRSLFDPQPRTLTAPVSPVSFRPGNDRSHRSIRRFPSSQSRIRRCPRSQPTQARKHARPEAETTRPLPRSPSHSVIEQRARRFPLLRASAALAPARCSSTECLMSPVQVASALTRLAPPRPPDSPPVPAPQAPPPPPSSGTPSSPASSPRAPTCPKWSGSPQGRMPRSRLSAGAAPTRS